MGDVVRLPIVPSRTRDPETARPRTIRARRTRGFDLERDIATLRLDAVGNPERPFVRADCGVERPCPWAGCRHHLALEVNGRNGSLKLNQPDSEVPDMIATCSLDVADEGPHTLEEVASFLNVTLERARQLEEIALRRFKHAALLAFGGIPEVP